MANPLHADGLTGTFLYVVKLFVSRCIDYGSSCFGFEIHITTFEWSTLPHKFLINAELNWHPVILNACQFIITDKSKLLPGATLVLFDGFARTTVINTIFDTQEALPDNQFNIMTMKNAHGKPKFTNTTVLCPTSMKANEASSTNAIYFTCQEACLTEQYTFEAGTMTIDGVYENYYTKINKSTKIPLVIHVLLVLNVTTQFNLFQIIGVIRTKITLLL